MDNASPKMVRLWDLTTGTQVAAYTVAGQTGSTVGYSLDVFKTGYMVRGTLSDLTLSVFDQTSGVAYSTLTIAYAFTQPIYSLATVGTNSMYSFCFFLP